MDLADRKDEYVVFVAPSKLQLKIFETLLSPRMIDAFLNHRTQPLGFSKSAGVNSHVLADNQSIHCERSAIPLWLASSIGISADIQLLKKKAAKEDIQYDEKEVKSVLEQALAVMPRDVRDYDVSTSGRSFSPILEKS
jgi:hypothetical protein